MRDCKSLEMKPKTTMQIPKLKTNY